MATRKPSRAVADDSVDALLATLVHPRKREILALREVILGAHSSIEEGVKWNAPSFRTREWFATIHLRARDGVQVILHLGAKATAASTAGIEIDDPRKLLTWLGKDRATVVFKDLEELAGKRAAFQSLLKQWIKYV